MLSTRGMTRIGLVLGAGGVVGQAYHSGVLAALAEIAGWDARTAEIVVGTSAGSGAAAMLRLGVSPEDLKHRACDEALSPAGQRLMRGAPAPARIDLRPPRPSVGQRRPAAPGLFPRAVTGRGSVRPGCWPRRPFPRVGS